MLTQTVRTMIALTVLLTGGMPGASAASSKVGFLIVAPDRGFLGNREVKTLVDEFKKSYPAAIGLIGREYSGVENEYAVYLSRASQELKQAGATEIVAIPLFLSEADPVLKRVVPRLSLYTEGLPVRWATAMAHDYLTAQIVLDRVETLSQHSESERLILIGIGASDENNASELKADIEKLLDYVKRYKSFREAEVVIYYDRDAEQAEQKNHDIKTHLLTQAAKHGRTLLVPAFIGPKFDHTMSLTGWLTRQFKQTQILYKPEELLPHPNALLWLKKTANRYVPVVSSEIGVVIMPHGATQPWNDAVEHVIQPLLSTYRIEMAYGMGDPHIIQDAVSRLEQQGARRIIFVRMYALDHQIKPLTDYVLGLSEQPPAAGHGGGHDEHAPAPLQVRTAALFSTFGGYEHHPEMALIHHKRILELSKDPANETVFLVAHGESTDQGNEKWLALMNRHIERLRQDPHCARLKSIRALTVREDWPEKREPAVAEARRAIEEAGKQGRVIVIANRLYGSGPYKTMLKGLTYDMNDKGLVDPILTQWLERELHRLRAEMLHSDNGRPPVATQ